MNGIYSFKGIQPVVHPTAYVHPTASVIGMVDIGESVYIGPGAVLRGDFGAIEVQAGCNVQENCTVHMFPGVKVVLEENAHVGHGAIVHGARVGRNALIGMNAVLMDEVVIGSDCIIGALSFLKAGLEVPARMVVAGNPAKILREVDDKMLSWKKKGTAIYQQHAADCIDSLKPCEPLRTERSEQPELVEAMYKPWVKSRLS